MPSRFAMGWLAGPLCCACLAPALAAGERVETVRFADPRWPAVQVVRGPGSGPSSNAAPAPAFQATPANTEIVTFGDGSGARVQVVRGAGSSLASAPPRMPKSATVETVRFAALGLPSVDVVRGDTATVAAPMNGPTDGIGLFAAARGGELDRVAFAVDGAESGHGSNLAMWRPEP